MPMRRYFPFSMRHLRAFALFLGSAVLAFASVWIAEKEFAPLRTPTAVTIASSVKVAHPNDSLGLSYKLTPGMRAMSVRVNEVAGVAGFALPGSFVDILVNTQEAHASPIGTEQSVSKIILEKVLVLAVAQETSHDDRKPKVVNAVTLEVTPEQSELLDLARNVGTLSLVLRNQEDLVVVPSSGVTRQNLLAGMPTSSASRKEQFKSDAPLSSLKRSNDASTSTHLESQKIELIKGVDHVAFFSRKREGPL